jgi:hypothetical protein
MELVDQNPLTRPNLIAVGIEIYDYLDHFIEIWNMDVNFVENEDDRFQNMQVYLIGQSWHSFFFK